MDTKYPVGTTEKPCTRCGIVKKLCEYSDLPLGALGKNPRCKQCRQEVGRLQTKANRENRNATTPCPTVCDSCGRPPGARALHWDHDWLTGRFRGWLCGPCNTGIGALGDCKEGVEKALAYLRRTSH